MGGLIDRQAAIDRIRGTGYADQIKENVIMILMGLPSAQPEKRTEERTETHACDCISRQAAIDALDCINGVEEVLRSIPSAQPKIIRCKDCKYGVDYYHDGDCYCAKPGYELLYFDGSWEFYCANAERREE